MGESSAYEADISILQQDIASAIANGATVNGVAVTPSNANTLTEIQGPLAQLAQAAPNAVGTSAAAAQAQGVLHTNEQLILGEVAGDANLQNALAANGVANDGTGAVDKGFQAVPAQAADDAAAITAATAGANLSDIGTVFNAATNLSNGGLNAGNITQFDNDMKAIATGLQNFISGGGLAAAQANTAAEQALATADDITLSQAQALTGVHVQTMLDQIQDQITRFDGMYAANPNIAARSTNDNLLDIIDIVQGDPALAASAGNATGNPSHAGGFAEQPGYLAGTIQHYQLISGPPLSRAQIISTTRSRRRPMERCIWIQRASNPSFSKSRDINSSATPSTPRRAAYSVTLFALTVLISYLSWRFVEQPFRMKSLAPTRPALFRTACLATVVLLVGSGFGIFFSRTSSDADRVALQLEAYNDYNYRPHYRAGSCYSPDQGRFSDSCLALVSDEVNLLLWGDSFAAHYFSGLAKATNLQPVNIMQATQAACMPTLNAATQGAAFCLRFASQMDAFFGDHKPDLVVMSADWLEYARPPRFDGMIADLRRTISRLNELGMAVVLFGPSVQFRARLPSMLMRAHLRKVDARPEDFVLADIFTLDQKMKTALARHEGFSYISVVDAVCPSRRCPLTVDGGVPVAWDHAHLTAEGSAYVMVRLMPMLDLKK